MGLSNFIKTHKISILSVLLVAAAAALGADSSFAMAVVGEGADTTPTPNPSEDINSRTSGDALQPDEAGLKTQLQGKAATDTDVLDAGLKAEDYDKKIVEFRRFRFPIETYIAKRCQPQKVESYIHGHYRSAATDIDAVYTGNEWKTAAGTLVTFQLNESAFTNAEALMPWSTVFVNEAVGYKEENGTEVADGALALFVEDHTDAGIIKFRILNPSKTAQKIVIPSGATFAVGATACSESQMHVSPETYLPEKVEVTLQKKIATCVITDQFNSSSKKVPFAEKDVKNNALYNFKRKCARSHWLSTPTRIDVKVKELGGNREADFTENGILRQIPMLYTHGENLVDADLMAISSLQFTDYAVSEKATAFCGKREMRRLMTLVNSADHFKDVSTVTVNEYGIKVRKWVDNFGEIEFVYDPSLDDIGYEDFMVIVDLSNAVRYYMRDDKETTRDMKKTAEAREAKEINICRIDCVALRGYNAVLVCPASVANKTKKLGGILASALSVPSLPESGQANKVYYLTAADATNSFPAGALVVYDADLGWMEYEGRINGQF